MWTELMMVGRREFFHGLGDKYVLDLQDFLHEKLPKLIVVALFSWGLMLVVKLVADRILRMAERQSAAVGHFAQVRTLTTVIRTTGIGIIVFLAVLQILPVLGFNLGPLLTSAGVAGVAIGLAAQNIVNAGAGRGWDAVHYSQFADHNRGEYDAGLFAGDDQCIGGLFGKSG
jgi:small conductance mechanosensitive channel